MTQLQNAKGEPLYHIVRFFADDRPSQIMRRNVTLVEARAHCRRDDTHGDGWFDGYEEAKA